MTLRFSDGNPPRWLYTRVGLEVLGGIWYVTGFGHYDLSHGAIRWSDFLAAARERGWHALEDTPSSARGDGAETELVLKKIQPAS